MSQTLNSLPVGAKVKAVGSKFYGKDLIFRVLGPGHSQDPADSVILQTNDIVSGRCFDAKEPRNSDSIRISYGNNRYLYSNLLQWLNSDAGANAWYSAQHSADQAPDSANVWQNSGVAVNPYDTQAGFMNGFTADFKNSLLTVTKRTAKPVTDGGGYEDVQSKFFLLSTTEVGLANENSIAEGSLYSLFNDSTKRVMVPTQECADNSVGYTITAGSAWYWWLRTPYYRYSYHVRVVSTDGSLSNNGACYGYFGLAPACALSKNQLVSDTVDEDGAYRLIYTEEISVPIITPTTYTFTGSTITPTVTGYDSTKMTQGGTTSAIEVGSYTMTFALKDNNTEWTDGTTGTKSVTWSIDKAELEQPTVTGSFTYDEETHSPTIIGFDSSHMVQSGDTSGTNAGDYTLTISLSDSANYKFEDTDSISLNFNWSIAKDIVNSPTLSGSYTYDGTEQEVTINGFDSTKMNKSGGLATNAGQYTVVISLIDSNNYSFSDESSTLSLTWTIEKANGFITLEKNSVSINATEFDTVDVVDSSGNVSVSSIDESIATSEIESNVITITGVDVGETSVTVSVSESLNYLATSDTIDVTVNQAPIPPGPEPPTPSKDYKRYYARHEKSDGSYELKSYWTSSQTVEFEDGQTLEAYKTELSSDINDKGDNIDYSLDDGKIYLYSGDTEIAAEDMRIRVQPNIVLDDISNLSIRVSNGRVRFTWQDPSDVVFSELPLVAWAGTKVVRKAGSAPNNATDGTLIIDSKTRNAYVSTPYYDDTATNGVYYYYRFFPYDTDGNFYGRTCGVIFKPVTLEPVGVPYVENTYTYTGETITPEFVNYDNNKMTRSGVNSAKNAGTYTVTFTLKEGYKWSDGTTTPKEVTWSIGKASVIVPTVSGSFVYNGLSQSPTITNFDSTAMVKSGDQSATNAGNYTLTISLLNTDNYRFIGTNDTSVDFSWSISKAAGYVTISDSSITVDQNETVDVNITSHSGNISASNVDTSLITVSATNSKVSITGVAAGSTTITITSSENSNYYSASTTVDVYVVVEEYPYIPYGNYIIIGSNAVVLNDEIHVIGGNNGQMQKHFKWNGGSWITDTSLPSACYVQYMNSSVVFNNEIHIIGGSGNTNKHYKLTNGEWVYVSDLPNQGNGKTLFVFNNQIHLIGASTFNEHYVWNGTTWDQLSDLPFKFYMGAVAVYNNEVHFMGSYYGSQWHYKWDGTNWTQLSNLPISAYGGCATVWNNEIHLFNNSVHYKYNGSSWIESSAQPHTLKQGAAVTRKNKVYIIGNGSSVRPNFNCWTGSAWLPT